MNGPPAVAVMLPYWRFWEEAAGGPAFRGDRLEMLEEAAASLEASGAAAVWKGLVDSPEAGEWAAAGIRSAGAEAVLVVQSMAVPPSYAAAALDALEGLPVVVWAAQRLSSLRAGFDRSDITMLGAAVGTPMLTNLLVRSGRPFELLVGHQDAPSFMERLVRILKAAAAARRIAGARIARVGRPIPGYDCVDVEDGCLQAATGIELVPVDPDDLLELYRSAGADDLIVLEAEAASCFEDAAAGAEGRVRSLRMAAALERLDREGRFDAGAMNCHVPEIRFGEEPGVAPCYGLGRETTRGIPWTCSGDVLTAAAMLVAKQLGGAALYHEIEAVDFETGEVVIANSGEHDLRWLPPGRRPRLQPNPWYRADPVTGLSVWFELPPGPATLVAFTPHHAEPSGFRLIAAEGEITGRSFPDSPTVGGAFRFSGGGSVEQAWKRWAEAGVNHHSAAAPGHLADQTAAVAKFLGVGFVRVS